MKNLSILKLAQAFDRCGANSVDDAHAYKILKMKSELRKAQKAINERAEDLSKEVFADDAEAALARDAQATKSPELLEKIRRFNSLYETLMDDETDINVKRVPFKVWRTFTKENDMKLGLVEADIEGVFFDAYEDEKAGDAVS